MRKGALAAALALVVAGSPLPARQSAPVPADSAAVIEDAAWLAGRWAGEGLGGHVEEMWSPPLGGRMVGHFIFSRNGEPVFYELMLLDEHDGGLRLRVKHFNPDFTAWEDRGEWHSFDPVSAAPGALVFRGLRLILEGEDLLGIVRLRDRESGVATDHVLRFRRAPL